jgi:hypothetical protein
MYCSSYSTHQGCYNPPRFKKSHPKIYEGKEVRWKTKNGHMDHFFGLSGMKVGLIIFLIPGQDCAFYQRELAVGNQL